MTLHRFYFQAVPSAGENTTTTLTGTLQTRGFQPTGPHTRFLSLARLVVIIPSVQSLS